MKPAIGCKIILFEPMTQIDFYVKIKGWVYELAHDRFNETPGYHVVYPPLVAGGEDYDSWSPKDVFDNAYREVTPGEMAAIGTVAE